MKGISHFEKSKVKIYHRVSTNLGVCIITKWVNVELLQSEARAVTKSE